MHWPWLYLCFLTFHFMISLCHWNSYKVFLHDLVILVLSYKVFLHDLIFLFFIILSTFHVLIHTCDYILSLILFDTPISHIRGYLICLSLWILVTPHDSRANILLLHLCYFLFQILYMIYVLRPNHFSHNVIDGFKTNV